MPIMVGGVSEQVKDADDTAREICEKVRPEVETRAGKTFAEFTPLKYKTQLVNGVNYFIKVRVGADQHIHIRAHKAFSGEVTFSAHQEDKSLEDEIVHFQ
ncbi:cystatin-B [Ixodes scapularis]